MTIGERPCGTAVSSAKSGRVEPGLRKAPGRAPRLSLAPAHPADFRRFRPCRPGIPRDRRGACATGLLCISQRPSPSASASATTQVHVGIFSNSVCVLNTFLTPPDVILRCQLRQVTKWGTEKMVKFLRKLGRDTRGATAVEYGLILGFGFPLDGGCRADVRHRNHRDVEQGRDLRSLP